MPARSHIHWNAASWSSPPPIKANPDFVFAGAWLGVPTTKYLYGGSWQIVVEQIRINHDEMPAIRFVLPTTGIVNEQRRISGRINRLIRIITVEREFGAGGAVVAQKLAQQLGWKLWDDALTAEIARMAHVDQESVERVDEHCDSRFYRLMKVFMRGSSERSLPVPGLDTFDADRMVQLMGRVMESAASEGNCVIVGRGAPYFLRDRADAYHVFVYAPWEEKIRRVCCSGKSEEEAVDLISTIDQERVTFVQRYFGKEWPNRHLYHLMVNSKVGEDVVVGTIISQVSKLA